MNDEELDKLFEEEQKRIKADQHALLLKYSEPLTADDEICIEYAKVVMKQRFQHGWHQLVSVGIDEKGNRYVGVQLDFPEGRNSDAELGLIHDAAKTGVRLVTAVTVHHKRPDEGGEIHVANSCQSCCGKLLHMHPLIRLICWSEGELIKVPVRVLVTLPFKRRKKNGSGGISSHEHTK